MPLSVIHFQFPDLAHIHCLFTKRNQDEIQPMDPYSGGNLSYDVGDRPKNVEENRSFLLKTHASFGLHCLAECKQVHGSHLHFVTDNADNTICADALATTERNIGLCIKTADCQAILVTDQNGQAILSLHVGWRANRNCFIQKAIAEFCTTYALTPSRLFAVRGPSLSPQAAQFLNWQQEWPKTFHCCLDATEKTMDLWRLSRLQLEEAGLPSKNIFGLDLCTKSNLDFFSYRRNHLCGRQAAIIWRN